MKKLLLFTIMMLATIGIVSAAQIAYDDFESNSFSGGTGWSGAWSYSGDCVITGLSSPIDNYHARGQSACDMTRVVDTSTYQNVVVSFWATATSLENGEYCRYYYYDGYSYQELLALTDGDDDGVHKYYEFNVSTTSSVSEVRMLGGLAGADYCYIDNVEVTGDDLEAQLNVFSDLEYQAGSVASIDVSSSVASQPHTMEVYASNGSLICNSTQISPSVPFTSFTYNCQLPSQVQNNARIYFYTETGNKTKYFNIVSLQQDPEQIDITRVYFNGQVLQGSNTEIFAIIESNGTINDAHVTLTFPDSSTRQLSMYPTVNPGEYRAYITDTFQYGNVSFDIYVQSGPYYDSYSNQYIVAQYNLDFIEQVNEVYRILSQPPGIVVAGTDYYSGEQGMTFLQLTSDGLPVDNATCHVTVYYPNITRWLDDQAMIPGENGLHYYPFVAPSTEGIYMITAYCEYYREMSWFFDLVGDSDFPIREVVTADDAYGDGINLNSHTDGGYVFADSERIGNDYITDVYYNFTHGSVTNITDATLFWMGESNNDNDLTFYWFNWTSSAWVELPNSMTLSGTVAPNALQPSGVGELITNPLPDESMNENGTIRIRVYGFHDTADFNLWTNWLNIQSSNLVGSAPQYLRGGGEIHISNAADQVYEGINNIYALLNGTIIDYLVDINGTTHLAYDYLQNNIYPAINTSNNKLDQILANQTNIYNKLLELQANITTNYDELIIIKNALYSINASLTNEINQNEQILLQINNTVDIILTELQTVIEPHLDSISGNITLMQADLTTIMGYTDTLEAGQASIILNLNNIQSSINQVNNSLYGLWADLSATNSSLQGRLDTIDISLSAINTNIGLVNARLDCVHTSNVICDKLDALQLSADTIENNTDMIYAYLTGTITDYLGDINSTSDLIYSYLTGTVYPAILANQNYLLDVLANQTITYDFLQEIQANITNTYSELVFLENFLGDVNQSIIDEINANEAWLYQLNISIAGVLSEIQTVVEPALISIENKVDGLQVDVDLIINQTDTLEAGQQAILGNLSFIQSQIAALDSNFSAILDAINGVNLNIGDVNSTIISRFDAVDNSLTLISNNLSETIDRLDCAHTTNEICDRLNQLSIDISEINISATYTLEYLNGTITAYFLNQSNLLESINQSILSEIPIVLIGGTEYIAGVGEGIVAVRLTKALGSVQVLVTGANCTTDILYPNATSFVTDGYLTEYGQGTYYYNFSVPSTPGVYIYNVDCEEGGKYYYSMNTFHVSNNLLQDIYDEVIVNQGYLIDINDTTTLISTYLSTTVYPEIQQNQAYLIQLLANQSLSYDLLLDIQTNVTNNYAQLIIIESLIQDANSSIIAEINANEAKLDIINTTINNILTEIQNVVEPYILSVNSSIASMQLDIDLLINQTDTLEAGQQSILNNLTYIESLIVSLDSNFTAVLSAISSVNNNLNSINTSLQSRLDTIDTSLSAIDTEVGYIEAKLDCNHTVNVVCDKLDALQSSADNITSIVNGIDLYLSGTITDYLVSINSTSTLIYNYLLTNISPAISTIDSKIDSVLVNQTNIWNKLLEIQNDINGTSTQLTTISNLIGLVNSTIVAEINENQAYLVNLSTQTDNILNYLVNVVTPSLNTINSSLNNLQTNMSWVIAHMIVFEDDLQNLSLQIDALQDNFTTIINDIQTVNSNVLDVNNSLQSRFDYVDSLLISIDTEVGYIEAKLDCIHTVNVICDKLDQLSADIATINTSSGDVLSYLTGNVSVDLDELLINTRETRSITTNEMGLATDYEVYNYGEMIIIDSHDFDSKQFDFQGSSYGSGQIYVSTQSTGIGYMLEGYGYNSTINGYAYAAIPITITNQTNQFVEYPLKLVGGSYSDLCLDSIYLLNARNDTNMTFNYSISGFANNGTCLLNASERPLGTYNFSVTTTPTGTYSNNAPLTRVYSYDVVLSLNSPPVATTTVPASCTGNCTFDVTLADPENISVNMLSVQVYTDGYYLDIPSSAYSAAYLVNSTGMTYQITFDSFELMGYGVYAGSNMAVTISDGEYNVTTTSDDFLIDNTYLHNDVTIELTHSDEVIVNYDYWTYLTLYNSDGSPVTPDVTPRITLTDSLGFTVIDNVTMTYISDGIYKYTYTLAPSSNIGPWETEVTTIIDGFEQKTYDKWNLISNPTQVFVEVINSCNMQVCAQITIENEGINPYEYIYYYWTTDNSLGEYGDANMTSGGSASKLIQPGDTWTTEICLERPDTNETHYFKAKTFYGAYSYASDYFTNDYHCREYYPSGTNAGRTNETQVPGRQEEIESRSKSVLLVMLLVLSLIFLFGGRREEELDYY